MNNKGTEYARACARARKGGKVPVYVIMQAKAWVKIADGRSREAYIDEEECERIEKIMRLMVHPDLMCDMYEGMEPYALWLITAVFCTKNRKTGSRWYTTAVLEIARKNFKTFVSAVVFIISMLLEPPFSRLFSVAPDFKISNELRLAVRKILKSSPLLCDHFRICRDYIRCGITETEYTPLAYSNDRLDSRQANVWLADEAGAMGTYPIEAMRSSQVLLKNKLGVIISTKYPSEFSGFTDEVDAAKKALDGRLNKKGIFALLYEPDESLINSWEKDDHVLYQANPVAVGNKAMMDTLREDRTMAILYENKRENFLCKHCNIRYKSVGAEGYTPIDAVRECMVRSVEWENTDVYIGVDLSQTDDNTAVAMVRYDEDEDIIYARVKGFIPADKIEIKSEAEKLDYKRMIKRGDCFACGDNIIDYHFVENYILSIERENRVSITGAGFDRYNAMSTMQKLESADNPVSCTEVKQHSSVLHPATKLLREYILSGRLRCEENLLLENSFENAMCTYDTNLNMYVNKKKSKGKVDMVVALINAVYMMMQYEIIGGDDIFVG